MIPSSTLANAHPPLPSLYLALWWHSGSTSAVTRTAMCVITAIALLAVYRLAILLNGRPWVAATTTVLTAIYPVWFAQSTLAHADMFAAAPTLWGLAFVFRPTFPHLSSLSLLSFFSSITSSNQLKPSNALGGGSLLCRGRGV